MRLAEALPARERAKRVAQPSFQQSRQTHVHLSVSLTNKLPARLPARLPGNMQAASNCQTGRITPLKPFYIETSDTISGRNNCNQLNLVVRAAQVRRAFQIKSVPIWNVVASLSEKCVCAKFATSRSPGKGVTFEQKKQ